jgi:hypothetical protein
LEPTPFQLGDNPKVDPAPTELPVSSPRDSVNSSAPEAPILENVAVHQPVVQNAQGDRAVTPNSSNKENEKVIINSLIVFIFGVIAALIVDIVLHPPVY